MNYQEGNSDNQDNLSQSATFPPQTSTAHPSAQQSQKKKWHVRSWRFLVGDGKNFAELLAAIAVVYAAFIYRGQLKEQETVRRTQIATQRPYMAQARLDITRLSSDSYQLIQTWRNEGVTPTRRLTIKWGWSEWLPSNWKAVQYMHELHYPVAPRGEPLDLLSIDETHLRRITEGGHIYVFSTLTYGDEYPGNENSTHLTESCMDVFDAKRNHAGVFAQLNVTGCAGGAIHNCYDEECGGDYYDLNPGTPRPKGSSEDGR